MSPAQTTASVAVADAPGPGADGAGPRTVGPDTAVRGSGRAGRWLLRAITVGYVGALVLVPVGMIVVRAFAGGPGQFWAWITTPAAVSALRLSLLIVVITVPLNVVFGLALALTVARGRFRGRGLLQAAVDLPFAVSPVVVGTALILLWGASGWFGFVAGAGVPVLFGLPAMVLATVFVTLPFIVREVEPVLTATGAEAEQAAALLGAGRWQTFRHITFPAIRWALTYGVVLTVARALGEFGAVMMVSSGIAGRTQTMTLLVDARYEAGAHEGAFAAATLLMIIAVAVLTVLTALTRRADGAGGGDQTEEDHR